MPQPNLTPGDLLRIIPLKRIWPSETDQGITENKSPLSLSPYAPMPPEA